MHFFARGIDKMTVIIIILFILNNVAFSVSACPAFLSVDITNGQRLSNDTILSDGILFEPNHQYQTDISIKGCVCDIKNCIRKCCPIGYAMFGNACKQHNELFIPQVYDEKRSINVSHDYFYYVQNSECQAGMYKLSPMETDEDEFYIQKDGKMYITSQNKYFQPEDYCTELFIDGEDEPYLSALVCYLEDENPDTNKYSYGMIISMPFLLLTFLVYAILPDRNLHGKCLMCYVITLFGAYALLVFIQLYPDDLDEGCCKALGIFCLFFFMVSFFWMNVMSIDIWWAFSGLRGFSGSRKEAERKRFILYCSYAWGMPMLLALVVTSLTVSDVEKNTWYNPGMGDGQCWFRDGAPTLVYFYGPMATLIIANITLFCITACKIKQVQQDTAMLRKDESKKHTYENDKQRFNLYLKLMLAMGVNWAMEIISWIVDWQVGHVPPAVWYITDFCNALYGVFVFFIFVFKQNIWKLLKRRYYMTIGKPHLARSMTQTTAYSPRTTGSSLNHNISTDKTFVTDSSVLTSEVA